MVNGGSSGTGASLYPPSHKSMSPQPVTSRMQAHWKREKENNSMSVILDFRFLT